MEEVIGRGGMSTVYRATDTVLDRPVAVKVLLAALAESDPTHIERFRREARAVAALHHPAVVRIYDAGVDGDQYFLVMEYVEGQSLGDLLRDGRALEPPEAVNIASRVAEALAAAHGAGILHRDIKPANVMLAPAGEVKVLDFGIARPLQEATLTQPASAMGTAAYMAPERVQGQPGDERSDIYGLGCLLYAMLTGQPPFMASEQLAVLHQQVHAEPLSPRARGARIGPGLELLVLSMLAKDPAARPQTAAAVAAGLQESVLEGAAATAATRPFVGGARQPRWLMPLALLAGLVVLVVAITALASSGGGPSQPSGASHRHATGSYHEPVIQTTAPVTTTTPPAPAAAASPKHDGPKGKGPGGAGPPGHDGKANGGGNGQGDGGD
jgi:serine/threonine-protein kinase